MTQSERATCERIKRRGPHHPLTRDSILLRVGAIQRALSMDEVSINMESNARLRDSWGDHSPMSDFHTANQNLQSQLYPPQPPNSDQRRRPRTCVPVLQRAAGQRMTNTQRGRAVSTAPAATRRHHAFKKAQPNDVHRPITKMSGLDKSATVEPQGDRPECCSKNRSRLPALPPFRQRRGFQLLPEMQQEELTHRGKIIRLGSPKVLQ